MIFYDPKNEAQTNAVTDCIHRMMDRAIAMEGTVSGEHAIGLGKKVRLPRCSYLSLKSCACADLACFIRALLWTNLAWTQSS